MRGHGVIALAFSLGIAAFLVALSPGMTADAALPASAASAPTSWSSSAAFDFGDHTYLRSLIDVSCGSQSLCVGVDDEGNIATSTDPSNAAPTWTTEASGNGGYPVYGISCPSASLCVAVADLGDVITSTDPADGSSATWNVSNVDGNNAFTGVSCPSTSLCVALDSNGDVVTSTDPTDQSPTWTVKKVDDSGSGATDGISCPTAAFCAVVGADGNVVTSTDPGDGTSATWTVTNVVSGDVGFDAVSCPSQSLCVALDGQGDAVTSTDPTDGASATWKTKSIDDPSNSVHAVSCPSTSLCVAADEAGNAVASTDPAAGASATWTTTTVDTDTLIDQPRTLVGISCARASTLCIAVDGSGYATATPDPTGADPVWTVTPADTGSISRSGQPSSVSCPSASFCAAVDLYGSVLTSNDPVDGTSSSWTRSAGVNAGRYPDPNCSPESCGAGELDAVSCPSVLLCVAVESSGHVLTSTNPSAAAPSWTLTRHTVDDYLRLTGVSCPSASLCVAVDADGNVVSSTDPTSAASWTSMNVDGSESLAGISCPSAAFCAAVDAAGNVITSTDPADGVSATWTVTAQNVDNGNPLTAVSCPSTSLCVAVEGFEAQGDHLVVSSDPLGDASKWTPVEVATGTALDSVSCPSSSVCVAVGEAASGFADNVVSSVDPTGGAAAWSAEGIGTGNGPLEGVSCPSEAMCAAVDQAGGFTRAVTAHTLSVQKAGTGSGQVESGPAGIDCGPTCAFGFGIGTQVTLTATPDPDSVFTGWSGGGCSGRTKCRLTLDADTTVTAIFAVCVVPRVKGKTLTAAKRAITAGHCAVGKISHAASKKVRKGNVISQSPPAGTHLRKGSRVSIVVSKGKH